MFSPGPMADATKENTSMTRKKARARSSGQMVANTKEIGKMESSMESASTHQPQEKPSAVSGMREKEWLG